MGALIGLLLGLGLLLIWRSGPRAPSRGVSRARDRAFAACCGRPVSTGSGTTQLLGAQVLCALLAAWRCCC